MNRREFKTPLISIFPENSSMNSRITIPSFAKEGSGSESLNAAVATAVTVAEFRRRGHSPDNG